MDHFESLIQSLDVDKRKRIEKLYHLGDPERNPESLEAQQSRDKCLELLHQEGVLSSVEFRVSEGVTEEHLRVLLERLGIDSTWLRVQVK